MRKMKDSGIEWIGEIPENWECLKAKQIFKQRNSKGNVVEVQLAATQKFGMYPQNLLEGVVQVKEDTDLQQFKTVHKNDYVISLRSFQGGFEMSDYEGVCSPAYQVFYNTRKIEYKYFKYLFKCDGFISKMNSLTVGIREGKNIQYKDFAESFLPVPPLTSQLSLITFLEKKCSEIDSVISKTRETIEEYKKLKQSIITEVVTGKVKIENGKVCGTYDTYKDSGIEWIGEIPEEWKKIKFKYLHCGMNTGEAIDKEYWSSNEYDRVFYTAGLLPIRTTYLEFPEWKLTRDNDLLLSRNGTPYVYLPSEYACYTDHIIRAKIKKDVCKKFLQYALQRSISTIVVNQVSIATWSASLWNEQILPFPPLSEQQQIADYLDQKCSEIDNLITKKEQLVVELESYKKSLIYEVVTGKREV